MIELTGIVFSSEKVQMQTPPTRIWGARDSRYIPVLMLRLRVPMGNEERHVQVVYKGETLHNMYTGDVVRVRGRDKDGTLHAVSIFNETTNSWITPKPSRFL